MYFLGSCTSHVICVQTYTHALLNVLLIVSFKNLYYFTSKNSHARRSYFENVTRLIPLILKPSIQKILMIERTPIMAHGQYSEILENNKHIFLSEAIICSTVLPIIIDKKKKVSRYFFKKYSLKCTTIYNKINQVIVSDLH